MYGCPEGVIYSQDCARGVGLGIYLNTQYEILIPKSTKSAQLPQTKCCH